MKGKVVLEEHLTTALNNSLWDASGESARNGKAYMDDVEGKLLDTERRIVEMDQCGIDIAILSLTSPGAQSLLDTKKAPLSLPLLLYGVLGHALFVGLPIALAARRITNQSSFIAQAA